jgi:hypothetical protein
MEMHINIVEPPHDMPSGYDMAVVIPRPPAPGRMRETVVSLLLAVNVHDRGLDKGGNVPLGPAQAGEYGSIAVRRLQSQAGFVDSRLRVLKVNLALAPPDDDHYDHSADQQQEGRQKRANRAVMLSHDVGAGPSIIV